MTIDGDNPICNLCSASAEENGGHLVLDTEYEEWYCDAHAAEYRVLDGPHLIIEADR